MRDDDVASEVSVSKVADDCYAQASGLPSSIASLFCWNSITLHIHRPFKKDINFLFSFWMYK